MNWILFVMAGVVAVIVAVGLGGLMMPATYRVQREIMLRSTKERVERCLEQLLAWPVWTERAMNVTAEPHVSSGAINLSMLGDDTSVIGQIALVVEATPSGTRVTYVESGRIGNPIARFVRRYTGGTVRNADAVLTTLAEQLDEFDVRPTAMT